MKVSELIAELSQLNGNREVIMAKDAEGNSHSPLAGLWTGAYRAETTWSGVVGFGSIAELEPNYGPEDVIAGGVPAVILTPVN